MLKSTATIIQSSICKTNTFPRPIPSLFYFPGLNSQAIYPLNSINFPFFSTKNSQDFTLILKEYLTWKEKLSLSNQSDYQVIKDEHKLHSGQWDWNSYILKGKKQVDFAINCPITTTFLESFPLLMHSVPFSYAFFSTLKAGTNIKSHYGPCNIRLRCHLPLLIPEGDCGINIGMSFLLVFILVLLILLVCSYSWCKYEMGSWCSFNL